MLNIYIFDLICFHLVTLAGEHADSVLLKIFLLINND